jgi:ferric-dicitrate binding protein FerR (iron transport regulator)
MKYQEFTEFEFISDEFFIEWVRSSNRENELFWKRWLQNHPEKKKEVELARQFLLQIGYASNVNLARNDFDRMHENIMHFHGKKRSRDLVSSAGYRKFVWASVAAAAVLLMVALGLSYFSGQPTNPSIVEIVKTSGKGMKKTVILPDGTTVKLNASSTLRYPEIFQEDVRAVTLHGEAFFKVARKTDMPFIIRAEGFTTKVLGTSFNLRVVDGDSLHKLAVVEGLVEVTTPDGRAVEIEGEEMLVYKTANNELYKTDFDMSEEIGWKDGLIFFRDSPLSEVFSRLEDWYGVNIHVGYNVREEDIYTGEFHSETLENVLNGIGYTSNFEFRIENDEIFISKKTEKHMY